MNGGVLILAFMAALVAVWGVTPGRRSESMVPIHSGLSFDAESERLEPYGQDPYDDILEGHTADAARRDRDHDYTPGSYA